MKSHTYSVKSLRLSLDALERTFRMDSEDFMAVRGTEVVAAIPRFTQHSWASFYLDWTRLSNDEFSSRVEDELELV